MHGQYSTNASWRANQQSDPGIFKINESQVVRYHNS